MNKTVEELQASLEEALNSIKKLEGMNDTLKQENKTFSSKVAEAKSEAERAQEKADREAGNIEALERRLNNKFENERNALIKERDTYADELRTTRVDNEIKTAIAAANVMPEFAELIEARMLRLVSYEDGVATVDGKSISDATKAYLKTPTGLKTVRAPESSGSGSTGATTVDTSGWKEAPQTAEDYNRYMKLTVDNPNAATALADKWNRPDLRP